MNALLIIFPMVAAAAASLMSMLFCAWWYESAVREPIKTRATAGEIYCLLLALVFCALALALSFAAGVLSGAGQ